MTQPKLKQLVKLLREWSAEFAPDPNSAYGTQDVSQPMYREMVGTLISQVNREIDKPI